MSLVESGEPHMVMREYPDVSEIRSIKDIKKSMVVDTANIETFLIKIDSSGKKQWERKFGKSGIYGMNSFAATEDGGFILAGIASGNGFESSAWVIKTNDEGREQWNRNYENGINDANSIKQVKDGGYVFISYPSRLIKIDAKGKTEWDRIFKIGEFDLIRSVNQASDDGYLLLGYSSNMQIENPVGLIIKTDPEGYEEWNRTIGGKETESSIEYGKETADGGTILAGTVRKIYADYLFSWDNISTESGMLREILKQRFSIEITNDDKIEKIDENTIKLSGREKSFFLKLNQEKTKLNMMTSDGRTYEFMVKEDSGKRNIYNYGLDDAWIVRTDSKGNELWNLTFGGTNNDGAVSLKPTSDGGYIITGYTRSFGAGNDDDAWIIKIAGAEPPFEPESTAFKKPPEKSISGFGIFAAISLILSYFYRGK
ncbi:MAG TPA: hypothetical protein VN368_01830 [Candidatus Methylomirabilis sp.]|nr:hypothetical protein [Candidatus Methylomirabilis sp.]